MGSILSALFSAVMNGLLKLFMISPEQKLGRLEVTEKVQEETIHELQVDKAVGDRVDAMSDAERVRLAATINAASER